MNSHEDDINDSNYYNVKQSTMLKDLSDSLKSMLLNIHIKVQGKTKRYCYCPICKCILSYQEQYCVHTNKSHFFKQHDQLPQYMNKRYKRFILNCGNIIYRKAQYMCLPKNIQKYRYDRVPKVSISDHFEFEVPNIQNYHIDDDNYKNYILNKLKERCDENIENNNISTNTFLNNEEYIDNGFNKIDLNEAKDMSELALMMSHLLINNKMKDIEEYIKEKDQPVEELFNLLTNYCVSITNFSKSQIKVLRRLMKLLVVILKSDIKIKCSYETAKRRMEDYNTKHKEKMEVLSNTCQCYTIAVDEAENDNEKVIAMVVRFNDNLTFYQTLLIVKLFSISPTGENITNWILQTLKDYKMDTKKLVGLTTDGANVMKGHWNGVNGLL